MTLRRTAATAVVAALTLSGCSSTRPQALRGQPLEVQVNDRKVGVSNLRSGITHTHVTLDPEGTPDALKAAIKATAMYQNQHIMGWGAGNPEPSPGVFDWESLDARMDLIREASGIPVLTLCCAPDWMKEGEAGKTDWAKLNEAPSPEHYGDFAALAGQVARRYPDVKHYQVWHGLKGFYDRKMRRWDYEGYTHLYNLVYRELKSVDPEIKVGGPYVIVNSWSSSKRMSNPSKVAGRWGVLDQRDLDAVDYWLKHKEGADFVTLDMSTTNRDLVAPVGLPRATAKISAITDWVRERTDLPIWAARWNLFPPRGQQPGLVQQSSVLAAGLVRLIRSGIDVELLWEPQSRGNRCSGCLWNDTRAPQGGQPTVSMAVLDSLTSAFPPGTPLLDTQVSDSSLSAISSPAVTVVINHSVKPRLVRINGGHTRLDPFETRLFARRSPGTEPAEARVG